jgi:hypothetical protein
LEEGLIGDEAFAVGGRDQAAVVVVAFTSTSTFHLNDADHLS